MEREKRHAVNHLQKSGLVYVSGKFYCNSFLYFALVLGFSHSILSALCEVCFEKSTIVLF